jgi:hypothetical protein
MKTTTSRMAEAVQNKSVLLLRLLGVAIQDRILSI